MVSSLMGQNATVATDVAARVGQATERMAAVTNTMNDLLGNVAGALQGSRDLVSGMDTSIRRLETVSSAIGAASTSYAETHGRTKEVLSLITNQAQLVEQRIQGFSDVVNRLQVLNQAMQTTVATQGEALRHLNEDTESFFANVREQVTTYSDTVQDSMNRYNATVSTSLDSFLGSVDTQLGAAVGMLGNTVQQLEEPLGELLETLKQLETSNR